MQICVGKACLETKRRIKTTSTQIYNISRADKYLVLFKKKITL